MKKIIAKAIYLMKVTVKYLVMYFAQGVFHHYMHWASTSNVLMTYGHGSPPKL